MINAQNYIRYAAGEISLYIKNDEDYQYLMTNQMSVYQDIIKEVSIMLNNRYGRLNIYNKAFLNLDFLQMLCSISSLDILYIRIPVSNCVQINDIFKKSDVEVCFCYEFNPTDENYYNKDLNSFTTYPCNFLINNDTQELVINANDDIDVLIRLLKENPQKSIKIEFQDTTNLKAIIDAIRTDNLEIPVNGLLTKDEITYIHNKYSSTKFYLFGSTIYEAPVNCSYEQIMAKEKILDQIISEVKGHDLSPFEQYMYLYNIVKNFKPYLKEKDNQNGLYSRATYFVLDNELIVCEGYATLLEDLVSRLNNSNLRCAKYGLFQRLEGKEYGHARNIVYINDSTYGLDNVFVSDPTWDSVNSHETPRFQNACGVFESDRVYDWYNHFMLTPEMIKNEKEIITVKDLFLDVADNQIDEKNSVGKNQKTLDIICNNNLSFIRQHLLKSVPKEQVDRAIYKIYRIIYQDSADKLAEETIKLNEVTSNMLFNGSRTLS